jgi:hypothetical protein
MKWTAPKIPPEPLTLAQAIARVEGYYAQGPTPNRPQRNFNPGDIEYTLFAKAAGAIGSDGRFAVFASERAGFNALNELLKGPSYSNLTIQQAVNRYAPPCENNTRNYVSLVCKWIGHPATATVKEVLT